MGFQPPFISIVSPVYRAEKIVPLLVQQVRAVMTEIGEPYEIILVDDRSPDNGWQVMKSISAHYREVQCVRLSRNFGQHPAIMAGLAQAKGEWIVVMDCDLQDRPEEIKKLYARAREGFDVVFARRADRKDGFAKVLFSRLFTWLFRYFVAIDTPYELSNFGVYHRKVIANVLNLGDYIKSFPLFVAFTGFAATSVEVKHGRRDSGGSSYTYSTLISLAFNIMVSYSNKPLKTFVKFGVLISALAFLGGLLDIFLYLEGTIKVSGYTSIIISIWFLSGVMITVTGVVGIYVGKVFEQTKGRPAYIVDEIV